MNLYKTIRPLLFLLEPETAHNLAIRFLKSNLFFPHTKEYANLKQKVCNITFNNPIGMAAGFDKNAQVAESLSKFGFGFIECGTVTPKAQAGNPKPRIFRLEEDEAIINCLGFNNKGAKDFDRNLKAIPQRSICPIGVNISKNKDTQNAIDDYIELLNRFYVRSSYIAVNISSPNTKNLRDLQSQAHLDNFLHEIIQTKEELKKRYKRNVPIMLKIAPDLTIQQQEEIAQTALKRNIDGMIISNTTICRDQNLQSIHKKEMGGLSGKPLLEKSNEILKNFYQFSEGKIPLIGVGGVSNAADAYEKIKCGASLVQIYSAFIYEGFGLVEQIKLELSQLVRADGFKNISQAIGIHCK